MEIQVETEKFGSKIILVDDSDYDLIKDYKWHISDEKGHHYARCFIKIGGKFVSKRMHRMIMGVSDSDKPHIDHINQNTLDNRRCNLRFATIAENTRNSGINSKNTTGYKGVYFCQRGNWKKYGCRLRYNGKKIFGGYFNSAIDAAYKYDEMARIYHGEFAYQNIKKTA